MIGKRLIVLGGGLAPAAGLLGVAAPSASAATAVSGTACSGTSCDGLDPTASYTSSGECGSGASTVHSEAALGGTLELRYGPNCGTNWTRFTPGNNDTYEIWVTNLDSGVWAGTGLYHAYTFSNSAGVPNYSDQVYSPGPAAACVLDVTTGAPDVCYSQSS